MWGGVSLLGLIDPPASASWVVGLQVYATVFCSHNFVNLILTLVKVFIQLMYLSCAHFQAGNRYQWELCRWLLTLGLCKKICTSVLSLCVYVYIYNMHHVYACCLQDPQDGDGYPGTGVTDDGKLLCGWWESNSHPLEEQPMLNHWAIAPSPAFHTDLLVSDGLKALLVLLVLCSGFQKCNSWTYFLNPLENVLGLVVLSFADLLSHVFVWVYTYKCRCLWWPEMLDPLELDLHELPARGAGT